MALSSLPSLSHAPARYLKAFELYARVSTRFVDLLNWAENAFSGATIAKMQARLDEDDELRVLGVGSGSGEMDCVMLAKLLQRFPRINNRVVEPAQKMLDQYKALAQSKSHELQGVSFDWRRHTIEAYEKEELVSTKFHCISAVHVFYHVANFDHSMTYLYNLLEPGGVMLIILVSDDSGIWRFRNRLSSHIQLRHPVISSGDVRRFLDNRGIAYSTDHRPARCDITKCFDDTSEEGILLTDFLTVIENFKETAPAELQEELMGYLASSDCSEKSGDHILINYDWDAITVSKPID